MKKIISFTIIMALVISVLAGCAGSPVGSEDITIALWSGYCMIGEDELEMDRSEWILTKLVDEYNEMQDNVTVEFTYFDDDTVMLQALKASISAGEGIPDIVVVQSGSYLEDLTDIFAPISGYVSSEYKESTRYWETVTFADEVYGYPTTGANISFFAYNKELVAQAGLDFEAAPPQTVTEFIDALETIKNAGIVPISAGDYGCNDFFSTVLAKWWFQNIDLDSISKYETGEHKFSEDEAFIEVCELVQQMWNAGYLVEDYISNEDTISDLANGKAAMYNSFIFELGLLESAMGDNLGILLIPDSSENCNYPGLSMGSCNQCMSITKASDNKTECAAFIEWLLNRENSIELYKKYKGLQIRNDVTLEDLGWDTNPNYAELYPCVDSLVTYPDYMVLGTDELADAYYTYGPLMITGQITPAEYAAYLDAATK